MYIISSNIFAIKILQNKNNYIINLLQYLEPLLSTPVLGSQISLYFPILELYAHKVLTPIVTSSNAIYIAA